MGFLTRCKRLFSFAFLLQNRNTFFSFFLKSFLILSEKQHPSRTPAILGKSLSMSKSSVAPVLILPSTDININNVVIGLSMLSLQNVVCRPVLLYGRIGRPSRKTFIKDTEKRVQPAGCTRKSFYGAASFFGGGFILLSGKAAARGEDRGP